MTVSDRRGHAAARLHRRLGRSADIVIANSHAGGNYAREIGVPEERLRVIGNGIDADGARLRQSILTRFGLERALVSLV